MSLFVVTSVPFGTVAHKELTDNIDGRAHKVVLFHYPIMMWNGQHSGVVLLYGHTHTSAEESFFQECISKMNNSEILRHPAPSGGESIPSN